MGPAAFANGIVAIILLYNLLKSYLSKFLHIPPLTTSSVVIPYPTTRFSSYDIIHIYLCIIRKHIPLSFISQVPELVPNEKGGFNLPELSISTPLVFEDADLITYLRAVTDDKLNRALTSVDSSTKIPPLFFAATTQPLFALLLAHPLSPLKPVGSVNTTNTFETIQPELIESFGELKRGEWCARAWMGGESLSGERKKRGVEWTMMAEIRRGRLEDEGDVVWRGSFKVGETLGLLIFQHYLLRAAKQSLKFLPRSHKPSYNPDTDTSQEVEPLDTSASSGSSVINLSKTTPYLWSLATGDFNPIHISSFAAKYIFGLKGMISHGNLGVAALTHALLGSSILLSEEEKGVATILEGKKPWKITLNFKRMVEVPTKLETKFRAEKSGKTDAVRYELLKRDGKVATFGVVQVLSEV